MPVPTNSPGAQNHFSGLLSTNAK